LRRPAVSDTETREALSSAVRTIDRLKDDIARGNRGIDRLQDERNAARAEVARLREVCEDWRTKYDSWVAEATRLRGVVEAVRALAPAGRAVDDDLHDDPVAFTRGRASGIRLCQKDLERALASVPSSGESESARDLRRVMASSGETEPHPQFTAFRERALANPETRAAYEEAMAHDAAARPVLSREAIREAILCVYDRHDQHAPLNHVNVVEWVDAILAAILDTQEAE
jgi:hypothetical protein